eukprot:Lankesteria_metandrocarpae@DN5358_c0_g1_i10.p1
MVCAKSILIVATSIAAALLIDATGGPSETSNSGKKRSLSPRRSERSLSPQRKESSPFPLTEAGGRDGSPSKVSEIDSSSESSPELPLSDRGIFFSCVNKGAVIQLFMLFNDVGNG